MTKKIPSVLEQAVRESWDNTTCYPAQRKDWNVELPEIGQCAVTALLLHHFLGGLIAFN